jgi:hypothetical protein
MLCGVPCRPADHPLGRRPSHYAIDRDSDPERRGELTHAFESCVFTQGLALHSVVEVPRFIAQCREGRRRGSLLALVVDLGIHRNAMMAPTAAGLNILVHQIQQLRTRHPEEISGLLCADFLIHGNRVYETSL